MSKINELRTQRAKTWEQTKSFLDSHRNEKGILSAEDTEVYERMEQEIVDLGHEIDRQERMDAMEREMAAPTAEPLTAKPDNKKRDEKIGRASDAYNKAFWSQIRSKDGVSYEIRNALSEGVDHHDGSGHRQANEELELYPGRQSDLPAVREVRHGAHH